IGCGGYELPFQQVRRNRMFRPDSGIARLAPALGTGLQAQLLHQPGHPVLRTGMPPVLQIKPDTRRSIGTVATVETLLDMRLQDAVGLLSPTWLALHPVIKPAVRYLHDPAHHSDRPYRAVPLNEGIPHCGSFAK